MPSAAHTAEHRSASEAFTAASNSAVALVMSARSTFAASEVFMTWRSTRHRKSGSIRLAVAQPCRLTMKLIQIGAKGDVQPFDTG